MKNVENEDPNSRSRQNYCTYSWQCPVILNFFRGRYTQPLRCTLSNYLQVVRNLQRFLTLFHVGGNQGWETVIAETSEKTWKNKYEAFTKRQPSKCEQLLSIVWIASFFPSDRPNSTKVIFTQTLKFIIQDFSVNITYLWPPQRPLPNVHKTYFCSLPIARGDFPTLTVFFF